MPKNVTLKAQLGETGVPRQLPPPRMYPILFLGKLLYNLV